MAGDLESTSFGMGLFMEISPGCTTGSLYYPSGGNQTIQIYGYFEGLPLSYCIVWVGNIMIPDVSFLHICVFPTNRGGPSKWMVYKW